MRLIPTRWLYVLLVSAAAATAQTADSTLTDKPPAADTALTGIPPASDTAAAPTPELATAKPHIAEPSAPGTGQDEEDEEEDARRPRKLALSAEIGINSLASLFGGLATYYALPGLALDLGAGFSSGGLRPGVRVRYLFTPRDQTSFFAGAGFKGALGTLGQEAKVKDPETKAELAFTLDPAAYADLQVGSEFLAGNGFLVIFNAGYSFLLAGGGYEFTSGSPSDKLKKGFDGALGSGIMLSVSLGFGF